MSQFDNLKKITDDFLAILHELYGFYYDGCQGFKANFGNLNQDKINGCPSKTIANGRPDDSNAIILYTASIDEMIHKNGSRGSNVNSLRGYMVIMICEHWNSKIRKKIAEVFNKKDINDIQSDIMGDISKIRNDLLHSRGKCNKSASNKIIKFEKGSIIFIEEEVLDKIFEEIFQYINQLFENEFGKRCYMNNSLNQEAIKKHFSHAHKVIE